MFNFLTCVMQVLQKLVQQTSTTSREHDYLFENAQLLANKRVSWNDKEFSLTKTQLTILSIYYL